MQAVFYHYDMYIHSIYFYISYTYIYRYIYAYSYWLRPSTSRRSLDRSLVGPAWLIQILPFGSGRGSVPSIVRWEFPTVRGPNIDPKY